LRGTLQVKSRTIMVFPELLSTAEGGSWME
jgi:hypothetical protein